jgi:hypothetical protein
LYSTLFIYAKKYIDETSKISIRNKYVLPWFQNNWSFKFSHTQTTLCLTKLIEKYITIYNANLDLLYYSLYNTFSLHRFDVVEIYWHIFLQVWSNRDLSIPKKSLTCCTIHEISSYEKYVLTSWHSWHLQKWEWRSYRGKISQREERRAACGTNSRREVS